MKTTGSAPAIVRGQPQRVLQGKSTDLTPLNEDQDRVAVVADMVFEADGSLAASDLYRARPKSRETGLPKRRSVAGG